MPKPEHQEFSPLFWPVELKGATISILDETALPQALTYIKAKDDRQACRAIRQMKTRAVGQVLLVMNIFLQALRRHKGVLPAKEAQRLAAAINATRPTLSFKTLTDMVLGWQAQAIPLERALEGFLSGLKHARIRQAQSAASLLRQEETVLTHCNVSGLMPLIASFAQGQGKRIGFFATETRPYLQGARLTAWELRRCGADVTLICDNMVAQVMKERKVTCVIVGADHLAQNGDFANKIGTYQIALLARHFGLPFYVLCPPPAATPSGAEIPIEVRPDKELLYLGATRIAPAGVGGYYPAFDVTPRELVTRHIHLEIAR